MKTKAFSYLRVSGKSQVEGDGFPRQRETIARYAELHEIDIVREFVEEGVSGTKENREALAEMLLTLEEGIVKLVLVERSDRLARDLMVSEVLLTKLEKKGIQVIAAESGIDLTVADGEPTKTLIRQLLGIFAEYEKNVLVEKLRVARERRRAAGGRDGRKPYGRDDAERRTIAQMSHLCRTGHTPAQIADWLNREGFRPRTDMRAGQTTQWHPATVRRILRANRILGEAPQVRA